MSGNLPRRRRPVGDQEPPQRTETDDVELWPIRSALALSFAVAVLGLAALGSLAWVLVGLAGFRRHGALSLHDTVGVLQLVFASVAGAGALVALVVAYRRQKVAEATAALDKERWLTTAAHDRTRLLNERFAAIAAQLGDDQPAVRLAGVHAMAGLADDWEENRQTCIDVLCAYLRMPYEPEPDKDAAAAERLAFRGGREVRHTVIRVITGHLRESAAVSWQGLNFDFTGVVFDGGSFERATFSGGTVSFTAASFCGGTVSFSDAEFSGGTVDFGDAGFSGDIVDFQYAGFSGANVSFGGAQFLDGTVRFDNARFTDGIVGFGAEFSGGTVRFHNAMFSGAEVSFDRADFSGATVRFDSASFTDGSVHFDRAKFSHGFVGFNRVKINGGAVEFPEAKFSGSRISFLGARFVLGNVDFSHAADWSVLPLFSEDRPSADVVKLPAYVDEEEG